MFLALKTIGTGKWILLNYLKLYHHSNNSVGKIGNSVLFPQIETPRSHKYPNISKDIRIITSD